jgi:predicted site-specific integrase-resolvase
MKTEWDLIREAAWCREIGVCQRTARNWQARGILEPAVKIAGQRWRRADERPRPDDDADDDGEGA